MSPAAANGAGGTYTVPATTGGTDATLSNSTEPVIRVKNTRRLFPAINRCQREKEGYTHQKTPIEPPIAPPYMLIRHCIPPQTQIKSITSRTRSRSALSFTNVTCRPWPPQLPRTAFRTRVSKQTVLGITIPARPPPPRVAGLGTEVTGVGVPLPDGPQAPKLSLPLRGLIPPRTAVVLQKPSPAPKPPTRRGTTRQRLGRLGGPPLPRPRMQRPKGAIRAPPPPRLGLRIRRPKLVPMPGPPSRVTPRVTRTPPPTIMTSRPTRVARGTPVQLRAPSTTQPRTPPTARGPPSTTPPPLQGTRGPVRTAAGEAGGVGAAVGNGVGRCTARRASGRAAQPPRPPRPLVRLRVLTTRTRPRPLPQVAPPFAPGLQRATEAAPLPYTRPLPG